MRKILPGDLIYAHKLPGGAAMVSPGFVIGISHERSIKEAGHFGCEDRVYVFWMKSSTFSIVCDCDLVHADDIS